MAEVYAPPFGATGFGSDKTAEKERDRESERTLRRSFTEGLSPNYERYTDALREDLKSPDKKFIWGDLNPGLNADQMFDQAMNYLIEAEDLRFKGQSQKLNDLEKSSLRGYNDRLTNQFGPEGTMSGNALDEMRSLVRATIEGGVSARWAKFALRSTRYK